ncbi:polysaccharide biosynthesis/export family protein [uncultured Thiodictyon sp.]|uniref:polysaccharide biosynthesis/export family protein n=1 Tax=uncultured Thiodictyon sp. TaxID=1846217 RepID=UPI0025D88E34|nr:polysaccharide biosynthesis/export family protein [uncultured Thiodictyon sp.]
MTKIFGYLLLVLLCSSGLAAPGLESGYKLGSGDVISIKVFGESDLSFDAVRITDAGTLPYPFLGEVRAGGRTPQELSQVITRGLADGYLVNPRVTINVTTYREFYVNGEVKSPGGYPYQSGLTVRKAIALAGGKTERASESKISVIREGDTGGEPVRVTLDSLVYPGDIVTIEESFF